MRLGCIGPRIQHGLPVTLDGSAELEVEVFDTRDRGELPGMRDVLTSKERPNRLQDTRGVEDRYREGSTHLTCCRRKPSLLQNTPYRVGIEGDELSCSRKHGDWKSRQQWEISPSLLQWLDGETNLFTFYAKRDPSGYRGGNPAAWLSCKGSMSRRDRTNRYIGNGTCSGGLLCRNSQPQKGLNQSHTVV